MSSSPSARRRHGATATALTALLVALLLAAPPVPAQAAAAQEEPSASTVTADVLPTVQVDGVVWDQVVVGDRVYVTGDFKQARPAGAALGQNQTARTNLLAYDIRTGVMVDAWKPTLDARGMTITASADGRRIFVGGDFSKANGVARNRLAALDAATGALVTGFAADTNGRVNALEVAGDTLYAGGDFTTVKKLARTRLAAMSTSTGTPTSWAPTADREVMAVVVPEASGKVIAGGRFETLNGAPNRGMGALDVATGATLPWAANRTIQNYGPDSAIWSLSSDGAQVYGTGYDFYGPSDFENSFAASAADGSIRWINGCLGDTYSSQPVGDVLYTVGHPHNCTMIGGHPQSSPETYQRAMATTITPQGRNRNGAFVNQPAPELLHWLPTIAQGTFTKQYQGAWSVAGDDRYVVIGGEFPRVNGSAQQGLARFTTRDRAPGKDGPQGYEQLKPTVTTIAPGSTRISWTSAWDRDDEELTYEVLRGATANGSTVLARTTARTTWWARPPMAFTDTTAPAGSSQTYRVRVTDGSGNVIPSAGTTFTVPAGSAAPSPYADAVRADGASNHWRLGEPSGTAGYDRVGGNDLTLGSTASRGAAGALVEADRATSFTGAGTGVPAVTTTAVLAPQTFSVETWVRTTSRTGGKVVGFGNSRTGNSSSYDRHIYMDGSGRISFGVHPGVSRVVTSAPGFNNGAWHHVVATLGAGGQALYVDGRRVALDVATTSAQDYTGFWRVGGDTINGWPSAGTTHALAGSIDEVAVYPVALTGERVAQHFSIAAGTIPNKAPVASLTSQVQDLAVSLDASRSTDADGSVASYVWDLGDGTKASGVRTDHTYTEPGTYEVTLTVTDDDGATGTDVRSVEVEAAAAPTAEVAEDAFERQVTAGLGSADLGGAWTTTAGAASSYAVTGGAGQVRVETPGATRSATLAEVSTTDADLRAALRLDGAPTGGGAYVSVLGRRVGSNNDYRLKLQHVPDGRVVAHLARTVGGAETILSSTTVPGGTYRPGDRLDVRLAVTGTDTTRLAVKVWRDGGQEPAQWLSERTDGTAVLQAPGAVGLALYVSGSSTTRPTTLRVEDLVVTDPTFETNEPEPEPEPEPELEPVPNQAPTAAFNAQPQGLDLTVDGSGSTDQDGSVQAYAWDFGDGSRATGVRAQHTYARAGSYEVRLEVTDDDGARATRAQTVTFEAPPAPSTDLARDAFARTTTAGLGAAEVGGAWTTTGPAGSYSVADGVGRLRADTAGGNRTALLAGVAQTDADVRVSLAVDGHQSGGGAYASVIGRRVGTNNDYRVKLQLVPDGRVIAHLVRTVGGAETTLSSTTLPGLSYAGGDVLQVRLQVVGTGTTTVQAKVWPLGAAEPAAWTASRTDTTGALQAPGGVGVHLYLSGSSTTAPASLSVDDLLVRPAATG